MGKGNDLQPQVTKEKQPVPEKTMLMHLDDNRTVIIRMYPQTQPLAA